MTIYCRICGAVNGACCGYNPPLLTGAALMRKGATIMGDPQPLAEYSYWVGQVQTTAMLTPALAERLGAVPVGEELPDSDPDVNNQAERLSSYHEEHKDGVTSEDADQGTPKARTARNKRSQ